MTVFATTPRVCHVIVAALALACAPAATPVPPPTPTPTPASTPSPATEGSWHIGVLSQRGEPECPGGAQRWVDVEPVIGRTPIAALSDAEAQWLDRPVVAHGHGGPAPARTPTTVTAPCPPPQMRSDWRFGPRGLLIVRSGGANHPFFERDALRPLAELTVTTAAPELVVDFRNPVPVALEGVAIRMHYEGCGGKPGSTQREHEVGALAIGAGVQARFPDLVDAEAPRGGTAHRAYSVQIVAQGAGVTFDLDVPLDALGAAVKCPDRP